MQGENPIGEPSPAALLARAQSRIDARRPLVLSGVRGGAKAWLIAALAERMALAHGKALAAGGAAPAGVARPLVVLTASHERAEALQQELAWFGGAGLARLYPPWDTVPYDNFSPQKETMAERLATLAALREGRCRVLVTTPQAAMQAAMPPEVFERLRFRLEVGGRYPRAGLVARLVEAGYVRVELVEAPGEFSARGEVVDIFPIQLDRPVRLDFFDDELESLRPFDVDTQRSHDDLKAVTVYPASEAVVNAETAARALARLPDLRSRTQPEFYRQVLAYLEQGSSFPGVEQLMGLLHERVAWLHELLPEGAIVLHDEPGRLAEAAQGFHDEVLREYEFALQQGTPVVEPEGFFLSPAELKARLALFYAPELGELRLEGGAETLVCPFADNLGLRMLAPEARNAHARLSAVVEALAAWRAGGARVFLAARSETGAERLRHLLAEFELGSALEPAAPGRFLGTGIEAAGIEPASGRAAPIGAAAATGDLSPLPPLQELERGEFHAADIVVLSSTPRHGFRVVDGEGRTRFALVTEEEMLGEKARPRRIETSKLAHFIGSLGELKPGDPVVHVEYGIGRYEGLRHLTVGAEQGDFLVLHYAGEDKVYIPVHKLNLVQKFTGIEGATPALNRLGDAAWQRSKAKARRLIEDMAEELVRTQAARKARQGHAYDPHEAMLTEFEEAFPFQETDDQARAIAEVLADMAQPAPMDRLVCGDVGFGKTEVAMRAAYLAALDGRQVLVLVPTTILAQQHFETFTTRFTGFPVTVDVLSRFRKPQEQKAVVRAFAEGKLDILIGTHRLLSKDVQPKNLGLLVIDEEQRFGVAHKEKIKQLKAQVEVLTLSATPIPRTLHMSLLGVRDLSIINTPPMDRLAVRTRVAKSTDYIIREAVSREVRRGGQVFFVHNRVETIHAVGEYLRALMPEVRIAIAHGQMSEKLLEEVMLAFVHGRVDLLLCTSIVESGLDIARANTMIVNNADFYGLAQLYQLRGRVGRSNVQAYAFLLVSPEKVLTELAQKRLTLLQELNDLGSGFRIASQDLEIRGAGNLLGREQSGHINAIGLELYTAMVEEAVARLKGEEPPAEAPECRIELGFPYLLPEGYIESTQQRLDLYKRLAQVQTDEEAWEMRQLLEDRYGHLPPEVVNLFEMLRIRLAARALGLSALDQANGQLRAQFGRADRIDVERLVALAGDPKSQVRLLPQDRVLLGPMPPSPEAVLQRLQVLNGVMVKGKAA